MKLYISLLIISIFTLISCDDTTEINIGEESLIENQPVFTVEFDGQTFIADYIDASIVDGITLLKAQKTSTKEIILIVLNNDQVGTYSFSPNDNLGRMAYKNDTNDTFNTSSTAYSGRIDINKIDYERMKLFGEFSFIGVRLVPELDELGQPILNDDNEIVYTEEIKTFNNGSFSNISFSNTKAIDVGLSPNPDADDNEFYFKIDGEEFVETSINATKLNINGVEVIQLKIANDGGNNKLSIHFPASVTFNNQFILKESTNNYDTEATATYKIISLSQELGAYSDGNIAVPKLVIVSHNPATNKVVGTFDFSAKTVDGTVTKDFTEGSFSLVYTE